ncbi:S8 family peptidase [Pseudoalteromonas sp. S2755]|uniref:S8 family serine peptidase n=1 Tax=Pseudoalteromonas sp. S2755 TaxID=2066523 RepID=UPI00110AE36C|nr:S8 family peptidase [Pseudoalteromonas sp. S2755]TMN43200.1 serine protease [Pseudoalteromonas sp. S2755]
MKIKITYLATLLGLLHGTANAQQEYPLFPGDPLVDQQWHLKNTGQSAFSDRGGIAGEDLNLSLTHALGIMGTGVTTAVIDGGVELTHPDLIGNVKPGSWDFLTDSPDLKPANSGDSHGTGVAGIIAASAFNGIGGRGVAPRAGLVGFNLLQNGNMENWLQSHGMYSDGFNKASFDFPRVFNQSYGRTLSSPQTFNYDFSPWLQTYEEAQEEITTTSHSGRGAIFVKSAGNGYQVQSFNASGLGPGYLWFSNRNHGLPMQNVNLERIDTSYWNLVVSAYNADGKRSSYSTVGSSVFVSAPGGEYGSTTPAIISTDISGCDWGRNPANLRNSLHGGHPLDPTCDYNATMNGTSSAAPNTTGAIALIMSANPALTWRDVRHILASTARKIDPDQPGVTLTFNNVAGEAQQYDAIPAWQTNAAGYDFHTFYGFGAIDVDAAVNMARFYNVDRGNFTITPWQQVNANVTIPDGSLAGAESSLQVDNDVTVEAVQIRVTGEHTSTRDVAIELISPSGTRSVLMTPRTGTISGRNGFNDMQMLSHHFYGESAQGQWTLRLIDTQGEDEAFIFDPRNGAPDIQAVHRNNAQDGVLTSWQIRFIGHN